MYVLDLCCRYSNAVTVFHFHLAATAAAASDAGLSDKQPP